MNPVHKPVPLLTQNINVARVDDCGGVQLGITGLDTPEAARRLARWLDEYAHWRSLGLLAQQRPTDRKPPPDLERRRTP
jgi:hypothetical protein